MYIRTAEEFTNKYKDYWRNIGHLKNAVHIPIPELSNKIAAIENYKAKTVILYGFGNGSEVFEAANALVKNGVTNINILAGRLFILHWTAANISGNRSLFNFITDIRRIICSNNLWIIHGFQV